GPPSFSSASFIKHMNSYPTERLLPGYYSNETVAITPFNADMGGVKTNKFLENYKKAYNEKPSWVPAFYYDAMHVAVEAITLAEIGKQEHVYEKRKKIRDTLARVNSKEVAIHGVTGEIHFNNNGDVAKPMAVLVYADQKQQPAFSQYQSLGDQTVFKKGIGSQIVVIDGKVMTATRII
ncbi:MAG: hypothetical protein GY757_11570, partial [bacterium]|nr:hypothetical protein [bacterium]